MFKKLLIYVVILVAIILGWLLIRTKVAGAKGDKITICHVEPNGDQQTLNVDEKALKGHFDANGNPLHAGDHFGACVEPTVTLTPTPSPKPTEVPCDEDCPTVTPTPSPTPTETITPEPTKAPEKGFELGGAPQIACEAPIYAPTLTFNGKEFTWTTVKDGLHTYWFRYGTSENNLAFDTVITGESFMPKVEWNGQVWASVAGDDNGCLGPFSLRIDP